MLVSRNLAGNYGYLPGGHVEPGESSAQACVREFIEETGLVVLVERCLLIAELRFTQDGLPRHEINLVFHVEHPGGPPPEHIQSREAALAFEWTPLKQLPSVDFRPSAMLDWVLRRSPASSGIDWISAI